MRLREAAAFWIEQGKALGAIEQAKATGMILQHLLTLAHAESDSVDEQGLSWERAHSDGRQRLQDTLREVQLGQEQLERLAALARSRAEELMLELEHPGATLARRLLAAARGARAAWRGAR